MSGVYLKYPRNNLVQISESSIKVSINNIAGLVKDILPAHIRPLTYKSIEEGFYLTFARDTNVNPFFTSENLNKLRQYNLAPQLDASTKNIREIYLPEINSATYYKPKDVILKELKLKNNIVNILFINKFTSTGDTRYFVITADSKSARDDIIKNKIKIFDCELTPQPKLHKKTGKQQPPPSYMSRDRFYMRDGSYMRPTVRPLSSLATRIIPSAQSENRALANSSTWGGSWRRETPLTSHKSGLTVLTPKTNNIQRARPYPIQNTPKNPQSSPLVQPTNNPPQQVSSQHTPVLQPEQRQQTSGQVKHKPSQMHQYRVPEKQHSNQIHTETSLQQQSQQQKVVKIQQQVSRSPSAFQYNTGKCTIDTINIVSIVSEILSKGVEHPEIYLDIFNIYLKQQGYESIIIPKTALDISKNVFHFKNPDKSKINIPFLTLYTPPSKQIFNIPVHC